ncbi:MAG TPA: hypothetical protein VHH88_00580 [Verrucomicrobiae bacterium]|nr:hypothetical protein [Verrucomicrobiae bacterium]
MRSDSEQFEKLRQLLAWKRHETPPPGYFYHFSQEVRIRIRAGETGEGRWENTPATVSWFQRVWTVLDSKPIWAGAFGAAVCGFFVVGAIVASENVETSVPLPPAAQTVAASAIPQPAAVSVSWQSVRQTVPVSATETAAQQQMPRESLFDQLQKIQSSQPQVFDANYVPSGN